jgi:hypothetical protein
MSSGIMKFLFMLFRLFSYFNKIGLNYYCKIFLCISEELFYQLALSEFHNFGFIHLSIPAPIRELIIFALESCDHDESEDLKPNEEISQVNFYLFC